MDLKDIIKGTAELNCVIAGGIAEYILTDINGKRYQLQIDISNKQDVGETATFMAKEKPLYLMRWIRKAIDNNELIELR